jgi:3',5'-cyclic AMP phosphodiesterase CpdA
MHRSNVAGVNRRGFMKCLGWAGAGLVWTVSGGVPQPAGLGGEAHAAPADGFIFVQISDSHIGFKGAANPVPGATLQQALDRVAALPQRPSLMLHTGDVTHLSKPEEFETAEQILRGARLDTYYVPGEHDVIGDDGKQFFARFAKQANPGGWYSFDHGGVHFVALVNVLDFKPGSGARLGAAQLEWLAKDLAGHSASTPVVVMAHLPLWSLYPQWGWATEDAMPAIELLKRFGSVTVLNGHIHQVVQKVEGTVSFHTAMSTAFPQPPAGEGKPGPMAVPAERLKSLLGIRRIDYVPAAPPTLHDQALG